MHVAEALHLRDRHPLLDEGLLCVHNLLCLDVCKLLHEIRTNGFQILAVRKTLNKAAQTPLTRCAVLAENRIAVLLECRNHLREVYTLHRRAARNRHDAPHHVQRDGICNLLKADLCHDLLYFGILLHQLGNRLFQIEYLFHGFSPLSILSYIIISM